MATIPSNNPMTRATLQGDEAAVRMCLQFCEATDELVNSHDMAMGGTTQLMHCAIRDDDLATAMATMLIDHGADVGKPDAGPGCTPCFMACQAGLPKYLTLLLERGADPSALQLRPGAQHPSGQWLDAPGAAANTTTCLYIAAQNGSPQCVSHILADGRVVIDRANRVGGRSPLWIAMKLATLPKDVRGAHGPPRDPAALSRDYCAVVGALLRGGADARRGCHRFAGPALNRLVESCAGPCARCREATAAKRCGRCKLARYCSAACQRADWPLHKTVCAHVARGVGMLDELREARRQEQGDATAPVTRAPAADEAKLAPMWHAWPCVVGFDAARDTDTAAAAFREHYKEYDADTHPRWEYFEDGAWRRYAPRIEAELEEMLAYGAPYFWYRPGAGRHCDGKQEGTKAGGFAAVRADGRQAGVSTRAVQFDETVVHRTTGHVEDKASGAPPAEADCTEYDLYSGACRPVRRTGPPVRLQGGPRVTAPASSLREAAEARSRASFDEMVAAAGYDPEEAEEVYQRGQRNLREEMSKWQHMG